MNKQSLYEKRWIISSTLFVFGMLIILPLCLTFLIRVYPGGIQPSLLNTQKFYGELILSQYFIAPEDNLTGIGVSIKNPNFANKKRVIFNILSDDNKVIRTVDLNGLNIADGKFVKILFEPIKMAKNKKFAWLISSPGSNFSDALEIFLTDQKPSWSLDLKINNNKADQTLSYVTLHRPQSRLQILMTVIGGWSNKIKQDGSFFLIYGLLVLILAISLFAKFPQLDLKKSS